MEGLSLEGMLGKALVPVAWGLGIPWARRPDRRASSSGLEVVLNEFVAFARLESLLSGGATLEPRSLVITIYALTSFANFGSVAMTIAGLGEMAPSRRHDLARLGLRAMLAGLLATLAHGGRGGAAGLRRAARVILGVGHGGAGHRGDADGLRLATSPADRRCTSRRRRASWARWPWWASPARTFPPSPSAELAARGVDVSGIVRLPASHVPMARALRRVWAAGRSCRCTEAASCGTAPEVPAGPPWSGDPVPGQHRSRRCSARVLDQAGTPGMVVLDTMPHWIRDGRGDLEALLPRVDVLLVNEEEVRLLGGVPDEAAAAAAVLIPGSDMGGGEARSPRSLRLRCTDDRVEVEAVAVEPVVDPTGAGDAFAGGLVASLARRGSLSATAMREALGVGAGMGAQAVSAFSFEGLLESGASPFASRG